MAGPFKLRSGNGPLKFKNMGSSPAKTLGIFDSEGNRISKEEAKSLEWGEGGPGGVVYTEQDAVDRALEQMKSEETEVGKILWEDKAKDIQAEIDEKKSDAKYATYSEADKKLQAMVESGEYDKLSDAEKEKLEKSTGKTEITSTKGNIEDTEEDVDSFVQEVYNL